MGSDMAQAAGGMAVGARTAKPVSESVEGRPAPAAALPMLLSASDFKKRNNSLPVAAKVKRMSMTGAERQAKSRRKKKEGHVTLKEHTNGSQWTMKIYSFAAGSQKMKTR